MCSSVDENVVICNLVSGIVTVVEIVYSGIKAKMNRVDNCVVLVVVLLHPL